MLFFACTSFVSLGSHFSLFRFELLLESLTVVVCYSKLVKLVFLFRMTKLFNLPYFFRLKPESPMANLISVVWKDLNYFSF